MKVKKEIIQSLILSLLAHSLVFMTSANIFIAGVDPDVREEKKEKTFLIKTLQRDIPQIRKVTNKKIDSQDLLKFENPQQAGSSQSLLQEVQEKEKFSSEREDDPLAEMKAASLIDKIKRTLNDKKYESTREQPKRQTRAGLIKRADTPDANVFVSPEDFSRQTGASEEFFDKIPGVTPKLTDRSMNLSKGKRGGDDFSIKQDASTIKKKSIQGDYKKYLNSKVSIYADPNDKYKYYKISVRVGEDGLNLSSMPKEIIFLIDCSISTQKARLEQFKMGIEYALKNLNPQDSFNIFAFKKSISMFKQASVKPIKENISEALEFVANLTVGEKTDTYLALSETLKWPVNMSPSYIILISDGRPTKGVTNSRRLINQISQMNNGEKTIFAFTGGTRVNRYLLDFIAYKNRGWTEYSYRTHEIHWHMAQMYEKIKNPILSNIRYHISGVENPQMYPKMLPDIFKNTEFTLYGRFTNEKMFILQLLGEHQDETNELTIEGVLEDAEYGDVDIARNWAFNKIYHLIGLLRNNGENETIIKEVNFLCNKFKIQTPYSGNIKK